MLIIANNAEPDVLQPMEGSDTIGGGRGDGDGGLHAAFMRRAMAAEGELAITHARLEASEARRESSEARLKSSEARMEAISRDAVETSQAAAGPMGRGGAVGANATPPRTPRVMQASRPHFTPRLTGISTAHA